jgi:hypothetical protein
MKEILFEERFAKNFKKLCGVDLLIENKLYPQNIEKIITNKIGDNSDDTLNMIAIFGLFRNESPFREYGDISKIKSKEELSELFNKWYKKTLIEILKTKDFLDNSEGAKLYLDAYVKNIKSLKNNAEPFTIKNIETTFIDLVNNKKWINTEKSKLNTKYNIYKPQDKDIQYEDDNIVILDGNTRAKCVYYGDGETWCISQTEVNNFNSYRITNGATIYFVLQKNVKKPEHKIVILNYNDKYAIADQTNKDDRTGTNVMDWDKIEQELPNLKGKEKFFKYLPISNEEKKYNEIVGEKYNGDNIIEYCSKNSENLYVNNSMVTPLDFFTDYLLVGAKGVLTDAQFNNIWNNKSDKQVEQMLFQYLSTGVPISEYQLKTIGTGFKLLNKYLKTYLKSRNLGIERRQNPQEYELDYIDISKINDNGIKYLLRYSSEREKLIYILLNKKDFISRLDSKGIYQLLEYSSEPEKIINILGNKGRDFISNLDSKGINKLVEFSSVREKLINILLNNKELISKLNDFGIYYLLRYSLEPEKIINILGNKGKDFISNLDSDDINNLVVLSKVREKVINILLNNKELISKLDTDGIGSLLRYSSEPEKVINILGNKGKELLSKIKYYIIYNLIENSKNSEQIKQIIKKYRPDLNISQYE